MRRVREEEGKRAVREDYSARQDLDGESGQDGPDETVDGTSVPDYVLRDFDGADGDTASTDGDRTSDFGHEAERSEVDPPWVEAREAAEMLGMSQRAVRNLIAGGDLEVESHGGGVPTRLLVSTASVKRLWSERRRAEQA